MQTATSTMSRLPQTPQSPSQSSPDSMEPTSASNHNSMASFTSTMPTPAHSVNGSAHAQDGSHDRSPSDDTSPNKRKRSIDDGGGERDHKKVHIETTAAAVTTTICPDISDLHVDIGHTYLSGTKPGQSYKVDLTRDMFEEYDLIGLAGDVARVLPNGEKNAMRKGYKGQIKRLNVEGHFDAVKTENTETSSFFQWLTANEQDWHVHEVSGKEPDSGLATDTQKSIREALSLAPGAIPKKAWDANVLGDLAPEKVAASQQAAKMAASAAAATPTAAIPAIAKAQKAARAGGPGTQPQEGLRSRRNGNKRSYTDASFEGYAEGFLDDDAGHDTGYSTGEGDGVAAAKRRKKNSVAVGAVAGGLTSRKQSYGPGMLA